MSTRLTTRSLYAQTEPLHVLKPGENIIGYVKRLGAMTEWVIAREAQERPKSIRRHDGRLKKRHRAH